LGLSEEFYSNLESVLHGTGQGSKASPVIWASISSVILILIQQHLEGVTMNDPECIMHLKRWMDGFVDVTTAWLEALLHATGLELDKCFYYIMHWEFDDDGNARLATPDELGGDTITIRQSGDNEEVEITHKNCKAAHRTLGVMINPTGTQKAEAERLLEKGNKTVAKVQAYYLPRHYAQVVYWNI
jgi:hypothetical protein